LGREERVGTAFSEEGNIGMVRGRGGGGREEGGSGEVVEEEVDKGVDVRSAASEDGGGEEDEGGVEDERRDGIETGSAEGMTIGSV
jgi:hypothetical protein